MRLMNTSKRGTDMDNVSVEKLSRLFIGVLAGLLGLAIYLGSAKWALARTVIPWGTCNAEKRCNVIRQLAEANCDVLWDPDAQMRENSNCEAQVDDYLYCLQKYCNESNYEIIQHR
jgi:hypothetical protein